MTHSICPGLLLLASLALVSGGSANADTSNKWRLEVSGNAESAGVIVVEVSPVGAAPTRVEVPVASGVAENGIARAIASALQARLNTQAITVEVDDGEDVLLKRADGAADFALTVVSSTVKDVSFDVDRE